MAKHKVYRVRPPEEGKKIFQASEVAASELNDITSKTTIVTEIPIPTTTRKDIDYLAITPATDSQGYPRMHELARREWKSIDDVDLRDKIVFMRAELNVPMKSGEITDYSRLDTVSETIGTCLERGARKIFVVGHLGRPKGQVKDELRLDPVAKALKEKYGLDVDKLDDCVGPEAEKKFWESPARVVLGENVRFHPEEEKPKNDEFAKQLARVVGWREDGENENLVLVNTGFGLVHRPHSSNTIVPTLLPEAVMDRNVEREVKFLLDKVKNPERPLTIVLSGIKDEKILALESPLVKGADHVVVGSGLVPMLFMRKEDALRTCRETNLEFQKEGTWDAAQRVRGELGGKLAIPKDIIVRNDSAGETRNIALQLDADGFVKGDIIPKGFRIADVGPESRDPINTAVSDSKTLVWFGPLGDPRVANESNQAVIDAAREANVSIIGGGGDTNEMLTKLGASNVVFMSTGGGASLHVLQFGEAPALKVQTPIIRGNEVSDFFSEIGEVT